MQDSMNSQTFEALRSFIYEQSGIFFEKSKEYLLSSRLKKRIRELNLNSFEEYIAYLKSTSSRGELPKLFDAITINETYFFRHINQINAFRDIIMPDVLKRKRTANIWSAASSTGEEPYTLIIALMEKYGQAIPAKILASDISQEALNKAKDGVYNEYSLKELSVDTKYKFFDTIKPGSYKIKDLIKNKCIFRNINLNNHTELNRIGKMDVIFCRNVLIYFNKESRQKVIDKMYDILNPGGYLVLGATESISRLNTKFKLCHFKKALAYQKEI